MAVIALDAIDRLFESTVPAYAVLLLLFVLLVLIGAVQPAINRRRCRKEGHRWNDDGTVCLRCGHEFNWKRRPYDPFR